MNKIRTTLILISAIAVCVLIYLLIFRPFSGGKINNEIIEKTIKSDKKIEKIIAINDANIILYSPTNNQEITSPIVLEGKAKVYENTFNYIIADSNGKILGQGVGTTNSKDINSYGTFSTNATFEKSTTTSGTIELFEISSKDGSIMNSIKINVVFEPQKL